MPRVRRDWTAMRTELRRLLRETAAADSFWTDPELLDYFNHAIDLRVMHLAESHEGWVTDTFDIDLIADQGEYAIPEGTDRIKRVLIVFVEGSSTFEVPLVRAERFSEPLYQTTSTAVGRIGQVPTYRFKGEYLILEPRPTVAVTNGLKIELEAAPARLAADGDKLDLRFPGNMETLLIYDAWDIALGVEDSQGDVDEEKRGRLQAFHRKLEAAWFEITAQRSFGRVFSTPYYLGD